MTKLNINRLSRVGIYSYTRLDTTKVFTDRNMKRQLIKTTRYMRHNIMTYWTLED